MAHRGKTIGKLRETMPQHRKPLENKGKRWRCPGNFPLHRILALLTFLGGEVPWEPPPPHRKVTFLRGGEVPRAPPPLRKVKRLGHRFLYFPMAFDAGAWFPFVFQRAFHSAPSFSFVFLCSSVVGHVFFLSFSMFFDYGALVSFVF